jgi:nucleotidyltransferase/DNA polymerase involved in DNA repair
MKSNWSQVIIHVDMDAFFASVEQLHHPEWRGKPVIVGADPKEGSGRGVVSTASYEARKYGVHSAMPISKAFRLCPHGIYVVPHGNLYSDYSKQVFEILYQFTPVVEILSIDEAFLDVTGSLHLYDSIENLGKEIKTRIFKNTGLTASLGIAPNKSIAKIASDYKKPDGLTIVSQSNIQDFLDPLSITKLFGVGRKMHDALQRLGIKIVKDLYNYPKSFLEEKFGEMGAHIYNMARGIDDRCVQIHEEIKSISHETTFAADLVDEDYLTNTMLHLSAKVSQRLRKRGLKGKTIQLKIRFDDFTTYTRRKTLVNYTYLTDDIYRIGLKMLNEFQPFEKPIRLIGIGVSQLVDEKGMQISLWDIQNEKKLALEKIMDQIQEKFGKSAIIHANTISFKKH